MTADWLDELATLVRSRKVDLDDVLFRVVDATVRRLDADRGTLYLLDNARQEVVSRVAHLPEISEIRLRVGEGVAGWVAESGELLNVPRGTRDPRFTDRVDAATGYRTRSLLAAPVRGVTGDLMGVLQVLNKRVGPFDEADEAQLVDLAARVGELLAGSGLASQLHGSAAQPLSFRFNHIVGDSAAMRAAYDRTGRAARTDATVLLRGESGVGKELFARAVHDNSARADQPFVVLDLAALPHELIENELFGHVRGAFTGADQDRAGKVGQATGGTLFLDEVGELPATVQAKLLRLIQDRTYFPVGGRTRKSADVRFVAATHRDLEAMVRDGRFREDLYYRLRVVEIAIPPVRDRGHTDLDRLIDHFLFELSRQHRRPGLTLAVDARAALHAHPWPGNVRELRHCIESAVVLSPSSEIGVASLPLRSDLAGAAPPSHDEFVSAEARLRDVELAYIRWVLARCDGNRSEAARRLGIGRNTLLRKLD